MAEVGRSDGTIPSRGVNESFLPYSYTITNTARLDLIGVVALS